MPGSAPVISVVEVVIVGPTRFLVERAVADHIRSHPDTIFGEPVPTADGWTAVGRRPCDPSATLA